MANGCAERPLDGDDARADFDESPAPKEPVQSALPLRAGRRSEDAPLIPARMLNEFVYCQFWGSSRPSGDLWFNEAEAVRRPRKSSTSRKPPLVSWNNTTSSKREQLACRSMSDYERAVTRILLQSRCRRIRQGRGDHERPRDMAQPRERTDVHSQGPRDAVETHRKRNTEASWFGEAVLGLSQLRYIIAWPSTNRIRKATFPNVPLDADCEAFAFVQPSGILREIACIRWIQ